MPRDIGSVAAGHAFAAGYGKQMDNIIAVVKIIAGRVHGRDRLLLVAAISRRQLMRRVTLYCRLLRDFSLLEFTTASSRGMHSARSYARDFAPNRCLFTTVSQLAGSFQENVDFLARCGDERRWGSKSRYFGRT